tara:strand:- start:487 stop:1194 length:708 start_codon:yes stop_codon:yes gene_type:complete
MNYITVSIIVLLLVLLILSIILFVKIYKKIKSSDKDNFNLIEFPKETNNKIENFISETKQNNQELINYLNNQYKDAKTIIKEVDEKIAPFEKVAREKNDELKEYKKGYDYSRNKSIIDGVIETIEFIEDAEKKIISSDDTLKSYLSYTKEKLLIILNNSGIESFEPKINSPSLDDHSCEIDIVTEKTDDEAKNNLICSVIKKGYLIKMTEKDTKHIKKAIVKVYEYIKKEDRITQ